MSDTKTFTVSGTDTEINDIVSKGANPLDNSIVNEDTKDEEEDDNVYEETIETDNPNNRSSGNTPPPFLGSAPRSSETYICFTPSLPFARPTLPP